MMSNVSPGIVVIRRQGVTRQGLKKRSTFRGELPSATFIRDVRSLIIPGK